MKIHERLQDRIEWFVDLYKLILREVKEEDVAKIIFKTIMFEENAK